VPVADGDARLVLPGDRDRVDSFQVPKKPQYTLVSSLDEISLLRRDLAASGMKDLPSHAIVDRGRLAGLWEFDPAANEIVWMSYEKPDAALKKAVEITQEYVRNDLGDARSFSLDSPKSRIPRIEAIRNAK
jgi:hypothetical protein